MKHIAIVLLTVISIRIYGHEKQKENSTAEFKRVQIGINFSPDICYRTLKNTEGSSTMDNIVQVRNDGETVKFGYTTGLNVCFNIKKFVGIETGIQYSNKGYQTKKSDLHFGQPDPSLPAKIQFFYDFHYIDIPIKVNFTIGKKKVRFFTSVGVTTNVFIKETQTRVFEYSNGKKDRKTSPTSYDYKKVNISPTASVGIDYKINRRMNLRVEPTFRFGVLQIIDSPVTGYLWNGGLNISYYFGL